MVLDQRHRLGWKRGRDVISQARLRALNHAGWGRGWGRPGSAGGGPQALGWSRPVFTVETQTDCAKGVRQ